MTISTRNRLFGAAFLATLPAIGFLIVSFPDLVKTAAASIATADHRAEGLLAASLSFIAQPSAWAILTALPLICVYASVTIALLYYSFEKTQAPEILYFAFFAFSFIGDTFRAVVPLADAREWPPAIIVAAARALTFCRFYGILSLFAAGVYANGIDFQKHGRVLIIIAIVSLTVATGIPVDGLTHDTAFAPLSGYRLMIDLAELFLALIAVLSFFAAAYARSAREFYSAGLGILLVAIGRDFLQRGDSWVAIPLGLVLLCGGTWLFAARIHRYYLWL